MFYLISIELASEWRICPDLSFQLHSPISLVQLKNILCSQREHVFFKVIPQGQGKHISHVRIILSAVGHTKTIILDPVAEKFKGRILLY